MDKGAHFFRCDFQVHTPRDAAWSGPTPVTPEDRTAYSRSFIAACRAKGLNAVAITDHHCMAFIPYIRQAAREETDDDGNPLHTADRIIVFPGMELTLGVPCQALMIFDADFPDDMLPFVTVALAINQADAGAPKAISPVVRMDAITSFSDLYKKLDEHAFLKGRYIVLPNLTDEGKHSIFRNGQQGKYIEMPCVGGYTDGRFDALSAGIKNRIAGRDPQWGHKRVACIQTSDARRWDHEGLANPSTWIKWAIPSAEAIRQACLAQESRIAHDVPSVPESYIARVSVTNSSFLGPLDLDLNPQYSALIGGRGTGKSTVLEYIRWALCDQPPADTQDDAPNYQARRARLIDKTLKPVGSTVDVTYVLNGVPHLVRRSSVDGAVQMKIANTDLRPCTEDEVRALLPIQAYSQKQLSDVSVRVDELTRFITAPIRAELDRLARKSEDCANRVRESYATRQRFRELSILLNKRQLEEQSITLQANALRQSLAGLSDEDRDLLEEWKHYISANSQVNAWRARSVTLTERIDELSRFALDQMTSLPSTPERPATERLILENIRAASLDYLMQTAEALAKLAAQAGAKSADPRYKDHELWAEWNIQFDLFQDRYNAAVERSSSHTEKLAQLKHLAEMVAALSEEATRTRETLATLSAAEPNYNAARNEWLSAQAEQDALVERECGVLTEKSGGAIRVSVTRWANSTAFVETLRQCLAGSRVQSAKIEAIGDVITKSDDPRATWLKIVSDLEKIADFDAASSLAESRPATPSLSAAGISLNDIERMAQTLRPENWLPLSLTKIESVPTYEFRAREGDYIPFENASAGQQATALLKTLLNQAGPPLMIDQPEEDLDNPVMIEIVEQIWKAKGLRQIAFASHNANLVVNGDAELVVWFGYRTAGDESRGTIKGEGAIDVPEAREAIKRIMEGGENAFRLRREKYGF
ncbi:TrlF family AAA-like ATPase [Rhizobium ruizarguesonis]